MESYNVSQIAELLKTNPETVRRWIRSGKLKAVQNSKKSGNIITEVEFKKFIQKMPKYAEKAAPTLIRQLPLNRSGVAWGIGIGIGLVLALNTKEQVTADEIRVLATKELSLAKNNVDSKKKLILQLQDDIQKEKQKISSLKAILEEENLEEIANEINCK